MAEGGSLYGGEPEYELVDGEEYLNDLIELFTCTDSIKLALEYIDDGTTINYMISIGRSFPQGPSVKWLSYIDTRCLDRSEALDYFKQSLLDMRAYTAEELGPQADMMTVNCPFIELAFSYLETEDTVQLPTSSILLH